MNECIATFELTQIEHGERKDRRRNAEIGERVRVIERTFHILTLSSSKALSTNKSNNITRGEERGE